jgi:hypothetical protein
MSRWHCFLIPLLLGGCATIIEGSSQQILVSTDPSGAECGLYREGVRIGTISSTPGSVLIKKTKQDIAMLCIKPGYEKASLVNRADVAGWAAGNILFGLLGGGIGIIVDAASGSGNKYDGAVKIALTPAAPDVSPEFSALPATYDMPVAVAMPPAQPAPASAPETTSTKLAAPSAQP